MKIRNLLVALPLACSTPLFAASGDHHTISEKKTSLLVQADKNAGAVTRLKQGEEVMEVSRRGDWVEVFVIERDENGWVHKESISLLAEDRRSDDALALRKFRMLFDAYNRRTRFLRGFSPFIDVSLSDDNQLVVSVSDAWLDQNDKRQNASLISLLSLWKKVSHQSQTRVRAIDENGQERMVYPVMTASLAN